MHAGAEVRVVQAATKQEGQSVRWRDVARRLLEAVFRFVGVLIGQCCFAPEKRVRRQGVRIECQVDIANDTAGETQIIALRPWHDALADDVEHRRAIVVIPTVAGCLEELADLDFDPITNLQGAVVIVGVLADGRAVVIVGLARCGGGRRGNKGRDLIVIILSHRGHAAEESAELGRIEAVQSGVVEGDGGSAFSNAVDDLDVSDALLPVPTEVVVIGIEHPFPRVPVTDAVRDVSDERGWGVDGGLRFQGGAGVEQGDDAGVHLRLGGDHCSGKRAFSCRGDRDDGEEISLPG